MVRFVQWVVLALGLSTGLAGAADGQAALATAPVSTLAVVHVDVAQLVKAPFFKRYLARNRAALAEGAALASVGVVFERDVHEITVRVSTRNRAPAPTVIVRGAFDPKRLEAGFSALGTRTTLAGQTAFLDHKGNAVLFDRTRLVFAPKEQIASAWAGKGPGAPGLSKIAAGVDQHHAAWLAVDVAALAKTPLGSVTKMLQSSKALTGSVKLEAGLGLRLALETTTPKAAQAFQQMATTLLKHPKRLEDPATIAAGLDRVLRKLVLTAEGTTLRVQLDLTDADLAHLEQGADALMKAN